ncbi:MAG: hypothetical protein ABR985_01495 [Methanotrichaceae archaeon]
MHTTSANERRKTLMKQAAKLTRDAMAIQKASRILPSAQIEAQKLNERAKDIQAEAESLKLIMRLEDITVCERRRSYWMASWREGNKVKNLHLGSCNKLDREGALRLAKERKAKALGISYSLQRNILSLSSPKSHRH